MPTPDSADRKPRIRSQQRARHANPRGTRISKHVLAPEVWRLRYEVGMTVPAVAAAVKRTPRYIRVLLAWWKEQLQNQGDAHPELSEADAGLLDFTPEAFRRFYERFSGRYFPEHWSSWVRAVLENPQLLLNVPLRHGKSTCMSVWIPIWLVTRDRNTQILIVSKTGELAKKFTNEIVAAFTMNEPLIETYGRYVPEFSDWTWAPNAGRLMVAGRTRETKRS